MSPKPSVRRSLRAKKPEEASSELVKAISADEFDQFIEEQLRRIHSDDDLSECEIVCHVY
jgi:hypothetical protein